MKKLNKLFAILVAMAMVLSLSIIAAFAADPAPAQNTFAVTKNLKLSEDLDITKTTGNVTVTITETKINGNDVTADPAPAYPFNINLAGTSYYEDVDTATNKYSFTTGSISGDDLGLANAANGVYEFTVKETAYSIANSGAENLQKSDLDGTTYTLKVLKTDTGYQYTASLPNGKVEIKNGTTSSTDVIGNELQFTNSAYDQLNIVPPEDPENAPFKVSKTVDEKNKGIYKAGDTFTFKVSVKIPAVANATSDVAAYIKHGDADGVPYTGTIKTDGTEFDVELAHGDVFYFAKLPAGSYVSAYEDDENAGTAAEKKLYTNDNATKAVTNATVSKDNHPNAAITNTYNETTFEGVLATNLPYIVLALVAIGGMVAYVVVRRRNADEA